MGLTLSEILKNENNGKIFIHIKNGSKVKNVDGCLFFAEMVEYIPDKDKKCTQNNIVHLKETGKIKWEKATISSFWVNGRYEEIN